MKGNQTKETTMDAHLLGLGEKGRDKLYRDSVKALRTAWPHRHDSFRAPMVIEANVKMIRKLRTF